MTAHAPSIEPGRVYMQRTDKMAKTVFRLTRERDAAVARAEEAEAREQALILANSRLVDKLRAEVRGRLFQEGADWLDMQKAEEEAIR